MSAPPDPDTLAQEAQAVREGRLQPGCQSYFVPAQGREHTRLLLLHGFTAGPWQWRHLAEAWAQRGIASWAPRLPGHGGRHPDGTEDASGLPQLGGEAAYAEAGRQALARVAASRPAGAALGMMGFSLGGAIAATLASEDDLLGRRQVAHLGLVAPMFAAANWRQRRLLATLAAAGVFNRLPYQWPGAPADAAPPAARLEGDAKALLAETATQADSASPGWQRPGHRRFQVGHLLAAVRFAHNARRRLPPLTIPCQLVVSDADLKVSAQAAFDWLRRSRAPWGVWRFPRHMGVPHGMLSLMENAHADSRARIASLLGDLALGEAPRHGPCDGQC